MSDIRHITALDVVARALEAAFRDAMNRPGCANCKHEMFKPFHGCEVGKQKTFAAGGEDCARFERRSLKADGDQSHD